MNEKKVPYPTHFEFLFADKLKNIVAASFPKYEVSYGSKVIFSPSEVYESIYIYKPESKLRYLFHRAFDSMYLRGSKLVAKVESANGVPIWKDGVYKDGRIVLLEPSKKLVKNAERLAESYSWISGVDPLGRITSTKSKKLEIIVNDGERK